LALGSIGIRFRFHTNSSPCIAPNKAFDFLPAGGVYGGRQHAKDYECKKSKDTRQHVLRQLELGDDLFSRAATRQVFSALRGLTSVFGMGTGGTLS
jgi:hypothetical protein